MKYETVELEKKAITPQTDEVYAQVNPKQKGQ